MHPVLKSRPKSLRPQLDLDRDVFEAVVDEAIEGAVASWPARRRVEPAAAAAVLDPSIMEALLDEILEEIAGHGPSTRPPVARPACTACRPRCVGCVS